MGQVEVIGDADGAVPDQAADLPGDIQGPAARREMGFPTSGAQFLVEPATVPPEIRRAPKTVVLLRQRR